MHILFYPNIINSLFLFNLVVNKYFLQANFTFALQFFTLIVSLQVFQGPPAQVPSWGINAWQGRRACQSLSSTRTTSQSRCLAWLRPSRNLLMNKWTNIDMDDGWVHPLAQMPPSLVNNYCHLSSDFSSRFQSSIAIFHHKLLTREGMVWANGWTHPSSMTIFVHLFISRFRDGHD